MIRTPRPLTRSDVLLAPYPDQVLSPGRAPLQVLAAFRRRSLPQVVNGPELPAFFPCFTDGFAARLAGPVQDILGTESRAGAFVSL